MRTRNHTIATLFLIVLIAAPVLFAANYQIKKRSIRRRMKVQLEASMLHTLTLNGSDIHWVKPGKELVTEGRMFDVKTMTWRDDGTVTITGLFDHEETALVQYLFRQKKQHHDQGARCLLKLLRFFQAVPDETLTGGLTYDLRYQFRIPADAGRLHNGYRLIPTPPPQA